MKKIDEKQLLLAVGGVGDDLLTRAEKQPARRRGSYVKWGAMAACFCLIAVLALPNLPGVTGASNSSAPPGDLETTESTGEGVWNAAGGEAPGGDEEREDPGDSRKDGAAIEINDEEDRLLLIPADVTKLQATHIVGGQSTETIVEGAVLEALKEWADTLTIHMEYRDFEKGASPGDMDGGEVYTFTGVDSGMEFSYVINGPKDCYVLYEGNWYVVSEPVNPPVEF